MSPHRPSIDVQPLESAVRYGLFPDQPQVLWDYLSISNEVAQSQPEHDRHAIHLRVFRTLMDAICDSCVAQHWRYQCLDQIYRPLAKISRLAKSQQQTRQARRLYHEMTTLSRYFL